MLLLMVIGLKRIAKRRGSRASTPEELEAIRHQGSAQAVSELSKMTRSGLMSEAAVLAYGGGAVQAALHFLSPEGRARLLAQFEPDSNTR